MDKEIIFLIVFSAMILVILTFSLAQFLPTAENEQKQIQLMPPKKSMMSFTEFDKAKGRELMDKDNDGKCDACGMPIEMCLDGGQIECSMNSHANIGILGSQHIHTDWKIMINGKPHDFSAVADRHERQMKGDKTITDTSAFIHIHPAQPPEKAGDVLHMHATGVPLSIFFESMGMGFNRECLTLSATEKYCNAKDKKVHFYVNGKPNTLFESYVFIDGDKMLISYGTEKEISGQLTAITDFAVKHKQEK